MENPENLRIAELEKILLTIDGQGKNAKKEALDELCGIYYGKGLKEGSEGK